MGYATPANQRSKAISDNKNRVYQGAINKRRIYISQHITMKVSAKKSESSAKSTFYNFVSIFQTGKGEPLTHTSFKPPRRYFIPNGEDYTNFISLYCKTVEKGVVLSMTEYPGRFCPLLVDIDINLEMNEFASEKIPERLYTPSILKEFVKTYQDIIFSITDDRFYKEFNSYCILLEKPRAKTKEKNGKKFINDGFHLHFPFFITERWVCEKIIRPAVIKKLYGKKDIEELCGGDLEKLIDKNISSKTWTMYGSSKDGKSPPYSITCCYDDERKKMDIDTVFSDSYKQIGKTNKNIEYYLPKFLSIQGFERDDLVQLKASIMMKKEDFSTRRLKKIQKTRSDEDVMKDLQFIREHNLIDLISAERSSSYPSWIDVGWSLFNIGQGCEEALEMWIDFSKKCPDKFEEGVCEKFWNKMELRGRTMWSLIKIIQEDSPREYQDIVNLKTSHKLSKSLFFEKVPTEGKLAPIVVEMVKGRYVCSNPRKDEWYEFVNHRWKKTNSATTLKKIIRDDLTKKYKDYKKILKKGRDSDEDDEKLAEKLKKIRVILGSLEKIDFIEKVKRMAVLDLADDTFSSKLNVNNMLLGCENCVLDLESGMARPGRPDDYISFSTGIHYKEYREDDEDYIFVMDCIKKMFPNDNKRRFFFDFFSATLRGGNVYKRFLISSGHTNAGKSVLYGLLEFMFGEYAGKFAQSTIEKVRKMHSSGPNPEMARIDGKRLMIADEVNRIILDENFIKKTTGMDSFFARNCNDNGKDIKPVMTPVIQCNKPPKITDLDDAMASRVLTLHHESKFDSKAPDCEKEQWKRHHFKADRNMRDKYPMMAPVLLFILFKNYINRVKDKDMEIPTEVAIATKIYINNNDIYKEFIAENLIEHNIDSYKDMESCPYYVRTDVLHKEFLRWIGENYPTRFDAKIGKKDFIDIMDDKLGERINDRWYGYSSNNVVYEEGDGDE